MEGGLSQSLIKYDVRSTKYEVDPVKRVTSVFLDSTYLGGAVDSRLLTPDSRLPTPDFSQEGLFTTNSRPAFAGRQATNY